MKVFLSLSAHLRFRNLVVLFLFNPYITYINDYFQFSNRNGEDKSGKPTSQNTKDTLNWRTKRQYWMATLTWVTNGGKNMTASPSRTRYWTSTPKWRASTSSCTLTSAGKEFVDPAMFSFLLFSDESKIVTLWFPFWHAPVFEYIWDHPYITPPAKGRVGQKKTKNVLT